VGFGSVLIDGEAGFICEHNGRRGLIYKYSVISSGLRQGGWMFFCRGGKLTLHGQEEGWYQASE